MSRKNYQKPDMLICLLRYRIDLSILKDMFWYRIPEKSAPKNLNVYNYLAFYQPDVFGDESQMIKYFGPIGNISLMTRRKLFPHEPRNEKSSEKYYKIQLENLFKLKKPIISKRVRLMVFVPTTFDKFKQAREINDLFHSSPLEDKLWLEFKKCKLDAERQYLESYGRKKYFLDFAMFCKKQKLNIECDGRLHSEEKGMNSDRERDNNLRKLGWKVLRYDSDRLNNLAGCVRDINNTINLYGGLASAPNEDF